MLKRCIFIILMLYQVFLRSQTFDEIKRRFDNYINYHGSLNTFVKISPQEITIGDSFVLKQTDWQKFAVLLKSLPQDSLEKIYKDVSLLKKTTIPPSRKEKQKDLQGIRIMIDPGHMAGNMQMARTEQKFLHFEKRNYPALQKDSVDIAEGMLTFQTASILKKMLEEKGAEVKLTRKDNHTSFGHSYEDWLKKHKQKTLDSLLASNKITAARHKQLSAAGANKFFLDFFKDYELQQRARLINAFDPDITVIIHYNVDEKNNGWQKPSGKDFCMTFIPGCFTADNFKSVSSQINLLRLLLTDDINQSEKISSYVVNDLHDLLNIPIAQKTDASYLSEHCLSTPSDGVYCRNLALCRMVQTPLVYGECLYQDSETEYAGLTENTHNTFGIKTNKRVALCAEAFYKAILRYFNEKK